MNNNNSSAKMDRLASTNNAEPVARPSSVSKQTIENKNSFRLSLYLAFIWLSGLIPIISLTANRASERIGGELQVQAEQVAGQLDNYLDSYRNLPELVARLQLSRQVLRSSNPEFAANSNRFLYQTNKRLGCELVYLLDREGTVKASSDYWQRDSIFGNNYSFRPYFIQAINGERGYYFASGVTTGKRGYFLSEPVSEGGHIIGVAVVKLALEEALISLANHDYGYLLIGLNGVIFAGSEPQWQYKTLFPLPEERRMALRRSRRYGPSEFEPISAHDSKEAYTLDKLTLQRRARPQKYFVARAAMSRPGWHIFTFASQFRLAGPLLTATAVYSLAFWLVVVGWLYWRKRLEIQQHVQRMNTELESRVDALTRELKKSNLELRELVDHYRITQKELEDTQDQLVQTAKLAVLGEMSAGINYELSQPLLALQTYTENCGHFTKTGQLDSIADNLREMSRIVANMGKIVSRFKVFSRRAQPELRPCPAHEIVDASLGLMRPLLKKRGWKPGWRITPGMSWFTANRCEDVPLLFEHFVWAAANRYATEVPSISARHRQMLLAHQWPGNVRELRNLAECFVLLGEERAFSGDLLSQDNAGLMTLSEQVSRYEEMILKEVLTRSQGRLKAVQEELGLGRKTLYEKMKKYNLDKRAFKSKNGVSTALPE